MAAGFRPRLGLALQGLVATPDQEEQSRRMAAQFGGTLPTPTDGPMMPGATPQLAPQKQGLGRLIAGSLGDVLLQQAGMAPVYGPAQQQRRADEREEVQWQRRRDAQNADWMVHQQYENANRPDDEFTRMMRAAGVDPASSQGRAMYQQRIQRQTAEPDVVVTLPNGQLYIGPKGGLRDALTGNAAGTPTAPVGSLTSIDGGPAPQTPGTFPYR